MDETTPTHGKTHEDGPWTQIRVIDYFDKHPEQKELTANGICADALKDALEGKSVFCNSQTFRLFVTRNTENFLIKKVHESEVPQYTRPTPLPELPKTNPATDNSPHLEEY